jgi:hypothetical protein
MNVLLKRAPLHSAYKRLVNLCCAACCLDTPSSFFGATSGRAKSAIAAPQQSRRVCLTWLGPVSSVGVAITLVIYVGIWLYLWISEWLIQEKPRQSPIENHSGAAAILRMKRFPVFTITSTSSPFHNYAIEKKDERGGP